MLESRALNKLLKWDVFASASAVNPSLYHGHHDLVPSLELQQGAGRVSAKLIFPLFLHNLCAWRAAILGASIYRCIGLRMNLTQKLSTPLSCSCSIGPSNVALYLSMHYYQRREKEHGTATADVPSFNLLQVRGKNPDLDAHRPSHFTLALDSSRLPNVRA